FVPAFSAFSSLGGVVTRDPYLRFASRPESLYVAGRDIGDEYRYVIERRYAKKFPGNMLDRPGLLLNPWVVHDTETGEQLARQGEEFQPAPAAEPSASAGGTASASEVPPQTDTANLDFLAETSVVLTNLTPNDEGVIEFAREDLGPHQDLLVVAVDAEQTVSRHVSLPEVRPRHLDLRLVKGLDPAKHFMRQRRVSVLGEGEKLEFADVTSTRFEVYDSLDRVFALYAALNPDPKLAEFRFLANWHRLEPEKKRELYSNYASHELHLFLYEKDPEFFGAVVRPYLENKLDKTFLDEWLLGRDLSAYREPWRFGRLNTLERILLGRRIDEETSAVARHVRERFELLPPHEDRFERIFQTALLGRALEAPVLAGVELRQQRDADGAEPGNGAFSGIGGAFGGGGFGRRAGAIGGQSAGDLPAMDFAAPAEEAERLYESESRSERLMLGLKRPRGRGLSEDLMDQDLAALGKVVQYYVQLDKTKEWAENNYYRVPNHEQTPDLIPVGAFWAEYAAHDPARPFRSRDLADATRTFPEMLTALALLDLPFEPGEHETTLDGARMTLAAASPLVVYHEEVLPAGVIEGSAPVLVNQNVFRHDDRYRQEGNLRVDKFVTDEFLVDVVYGCQVVVTNPTSTPRQLDVLLQVPVGAVPVLNGRPTKGVRLDLAPYGTQVVEYHFYFPTPGDFAHYPVQVSDGEKALAAAASVTFHVVAEPSRVDAGSWAYVSQHGSDEEVLAFLETKNVQRLDLARIAFRMKDPAFFERAIALLSARHAYDRTLWSYGVFHGHAPTIREFLRHADEFVAQTGEYLRSPL
ncbi:MAG TPA: hypothetical protein VF170_02925, partial [Planctomycetaceae bacterium]